jgi:predicted transposase YdaD
MDERDYENLRQREREEGLQQGRLEIARNLLAEGVEPAIVAKTTALSPDDLVTLAKSDKSQYKRFWA